MRQEAERIRPSVDDAWARVAPQLASPALRRRRPSRSRWWVVPSAAVAAVAIVALAVVLVEGARSTRVEIGPAGPGTPGPDAKGPRDRAGYVGPFEGIFPAISWEEYDRLQDGLTQGQERWVSDPEQVARSYLVTRLGAEDRGHLRALDRLAAEYRWKGGRVVLWRYGPSGSPWVVTAAEAAGVEVGIGDYQTERVALHVGVSLDRPGSLTVRAGTLAVEWIAEHRVSLPQGGTTDVRLIVGSQAAPGPKALLADVEVRFADGRAGRAQYRANATDGLGAGEREPAADPAADPAAPSVELRADGLGVVRFGASPDEAVRSLTAALGRPDKDSGWTAYSTLQPDFGVCGGTEWRLVRWAQLGVLFTNDGDSPYAAGGVRHFESYGYGWFRDAPPATPALATPEGLTLGHAYGDARSRYGSRVTFSAGNEVQAPAISVDLGGLNALVGTLDGRTRTAPIVQIRGGDPCGE